MLLVLESQYSIYITVFIYFSRSRSRSPLPSRAALQMKPRSPPKHSGGPQLQLQLPPLPKLPQEKPPLPSQKPQSQHIQNHLQNVQAHIQSFSQMQHGQQSSIQTHQTNNVGHSSHHLAQSQVYQSPMPSQQMQFQHVSIYVPNLFFMFNVLEKETKF